MKSKSHLPPLFFSLRASPRLPMDTFSWAQGNSSNPLELAQFFFFHPSRTTPLIPAFSHDTRLLSLERGNQAIFSSKGHSLVCLQAKLPGSDGTIFALAHLFPAPPTSPHLTLSPGTQAYACYRFLRISPTYSQETKHGKNKV